MKALLKTRGNSTLCGTNINSIIIPEVLFGYINLRKPHSSNISPWQHISVQLNSYRPSTCYWTQHGGSLIDNTFSILRVLNFAYAEIFTFRVYLISRRCYLKLYFACILFREGVTWNYISRVFNFAKVLPEIIFRVHLISPRCYLKLYFACI